jgi:hypothetical protein
MGAAEDIFNLVSSNRNKMAARIAELEQKNATLASSLQEATRQARLEEAKWWRKFGGKVGGQHKRPCTCCFCARIVELEAALSNTSPPLQGATGGK